MPLKRTLLSTALVVVALVLQVSVLARLHLPGAVPDLLMLVVLGLALTYGHVGGCLVGFGAGLLADLAPPADHAAGRYALVLCVIGYLAGLARPDGSQLRSAAMPMAVVAAAAILSTLLYASVGALVGDTAARHVGIVKLLFTATVYDLLLAPFTVPWIMKLARTLDNDPLAGDSGGNAGTGPYRWLSSGTTRAPRLTRTGVGGQRGSLLKGGRKL
jgi:rod shape-determining protein MreD